MRIDFGIRLATMGGFCGELCVVESFWSCIYRSTYVYFFSIEVLLKR